MSYIVVDTVVPIEVNYVDCMCYCLMSVMRVVQVHG